MYWEAVNDLFHTYATKDIMEGKDANAMHSRQSLDKSSAEYAEAMWNKALRYDRHIIRMY